MKIEKLPSPEVYDACAEASKFAMEKSKLPADITNEKPITIEWIRNVIESEKVK